MEGHMYNKGILKAVLVILAAVVVSLAADAGTRTRMKPLRFEGIALKGDIDRFVRDLHGQGYFVTGEGENEVYMTGTWNGNRGARVTVKAGRIDHEVKAVEVACRVNDEWTEIEAAYGATVDAMRKAYGEPVETVATFGDKEVREHASRILKMVAGKNDHHTAWNLKGGSVVVSAEYRDGQFCIITKYLKNRQF